jgi:hypothetical protein
MPTGVYRDRVKPEFREFLKSFRLMQPMGTPDDDANVAEDLGRSGGPRKWAASAGYRRSTCLTSDLLTMLEVEITQTWMFVRTAS